MGNVDEPFLLTQGDGLRRSKRQLISEAVGNLKTTIQGPTQRKSPVRAGLVHAGYVFGAFGSEAARAAARRRIVQGAAVFVQELNAAIEDAHSHSRNTLSLPPQIAVSVKMASTVGLCSSLLTLGS